MKLGNAVFVSFVLSLCYKTYVREMCAKVTSNLKYMQTSLMCYKRKL